MTSMEQELSRKVSMNQVRETIKRHIEAVFGVELVMTDLLELQDFLRRPVRFGQMKTARHFSRAFLRVTPRDGLPSLRSG